MSFGLKPTCSSKSPNMQHDCTLKWLEGLDEGEGEWAEFKRGRGRTKSVLAN